MDDSIVHDPPSESDTESVEFKAPQKTVGVVFTVRFVATPC